MIIEDQVAKKSQDQPPQFEKDACENKGDMGTPDAISDSATDLLDLNALENAEKSGMSGITQRIGGYFKEAVVTCFEENGHASGVRLEVDGDSAHSMKVVWSIEGDADQRFNAWADRSVAAENGAYGIAALLINSLTEYTIAVRSQKGSGIDYWLGKKGAEEPLFQAKARLEVSGILSGNESDIKNRVRLKEEQITLSDGNLPGIIVVAEFSSPRARMRTKR